MAHLGQQRPTASLQPSLRDRFRAMVQARQTRRLLARMDDRMLADIGLGRGDAMIEAARPMWDTDQARP
jgi:uncharacterized protein YjiS (DUF1127 family)